MIWKSISYFKEMCRVRFLMGEIFNLGERTVQVVHTPGHSPGHHSFSISTDLADRIESACRKLDKEKKWKQGSGIFDFGDFKIHL